MELICRAQANTAALYRCYTEVQLRHSPSSGLWAGTPQAPGRWAKIDQSSLGGVFGQTKYDVMMRYGAGRRCSFLIHSTTVLSNIKIEYGRLRS